MYFVAKNQHSYYFPQGNQLFMFNERGVFLVKTFDFVVHTFAFDGNFFLLNKKVCYDTFTDTFTDWEHVPFPLIFSTHDATHWYENARRIASYDEEFEEITRVNNELFIGTQSNINMLCYRNGQIKFFDFGSVRRNSNRIFVATATVDSDYLIDDFITLTVYDSQLRILVKLAIDVDFDSFEVDESHLFVRSENHLRIYSLQHSYDFAMQNQNTTDTLSNLTLVREVDSSQILGEFVKLAYCGNALLQYSKNRFDILQF